MGTYDHEALVATVGTTSNKNRRYKTSLAELNVDDE